MTPLLEALAQPGALITLLVFALAIVLFITGWLAPEVTGLLAAGLLIATGVLKPSEAVEGFGSTALVTLMGSSPSQRGCSAPAASTGCGP